MKKVLITGILGQDGSNLADYLLFGDNKGLYKVYGMMKRYSNPNLTNIKLALTSEYFELVSGDITDQASMDNLIMELQPDYLVNFAANSFVGTSWKAPEQVFNVNALGVLRCLEAIRKHKKDCRFYSAGSSEEFGVAQGVQDENTPTIPVSPYAVAKVAARNLVSVYRDSYGLFAIHGTLFNHEGPRRGTEFVTRKITSNVARIKKALAYQLKYNIVPFSLGNINAEKDWSDSRDMVRGIWMMLNAKEPKPYILASGITRTVKDFIQEAFDVAGISGYWNSDMTRYVGSLNGNGYEHTLIEIDPSLFRPTETGHQCGNYNAIYKDLGWEPKISFRQMIVDMIEEDSK